jgi:hypothetical protein
MAKKPLNDKELAEKAFKMSVDKLIPFHKAISYIKANLSNPTPPKDKK